MKQLFCFQTILDGVEQTAYTGPVKASADIRAASDEPALAWICIYSL